MVPKIEVEEYLTEDGSSPFGRWFDDLDPQAAAIVTVAIGWHAEGSPSNSKSIGVPRLEVTMPLTRDFRETVQARAARDPAFRGAMFQEAVSALLSGDVGGGRAALRGYINATIGFERLSVLLGRPEKSLMRMFGPSGNPTAENLLGVISVLQAETGVRLEVRAVASE